MNSGREEFAGEAIRLLPRGTVSFYTDRTGCLILCDVQPRDPDFDLNKYIKSDEDTWIKGLERLELDGYSFYNGGPYYTFDE